MRHLPDISFMKKPGIYVMVYFFYSVVSNSHKGWTFFPSVKITALFQKLNVILSFSGSLIFQFPEIENENYLISALQ